MGVPAREGRADPSLDPTDNIEKPPKRPEVAIVGEVGIGVVICIEEAFGSISIEERKDLSGRSAMLEVCDKKMSSRAFWSVRRTP